jgi:hypothetical protein
LAAAFGAGPWAQSQTSLAGGNGLSTSHNVGGATDPFVAQLAVQIAQQMSAAATLRRGEQALR